MTVVKLINDILVSEEKTDIPTKPNVGINQDSWRMLRNGIKEFGKESILAEVDNRLGVVTKRDARRTLEDIKNYLSPPDPIPEPPTPTPVPDPEEEEEACPDGYKPCKKCDGEGWVECKKCRGVGEKVCKKCHESGCVREPRRWRSWRRR